MFKKLWLLILVLAAVFLTGCATSASQNAMTMGVADIPAKIKSDLKGNISIRSVSGGQETNPLWVSKVDNQGFKAALEQSMIAVGYLAPKGSSAKYQVDAALQNLEQPLFGLTFDVKSAVTYTISSENSQKTYPVSAVGTASPSDSLVGMERMRIANERSIKENIKSFISKISE